MSYLFLLTNNGINGTEGKKNGSQSYSYWKAIKKKNPSSGQNMHAERERGL